MIRNDRYPHVFQPLTIRGVTLKNRLEYAPTVVLKCSPEGEVTQEMLDYVAWQAKTGVGYLDHRQYPGGAYGFLGLGLRAERHPGSLHSRPGDDGPHCPGKRRRDERGAGPCRTRQ